MSPRAFALPLIGMVIAAALALPAGAPAAVSPTLTVNQAAGTVAGSTTPTGFALGFNGTPGNAVTNVSLDFPPGLIVPEGIDGGACLTAGTPQATCRIGSGTATIAGVATPMSLYLVKPASAGDVGGVMAIAGSTVLTGTLDFGNALSISDGLSVVTREALNVSGLAPASVSALNFTLTDLHLPTSCPPSPAIATLRATSQTAPTQSVTRAPVSVTGCGGLSFTPAVSDLVARDPGTTGTASLITTVTQFPGQSSIQNMILGLPTTTIALNNALEPCVTGTPCNIGSASITSPLLPASALANGAIMLGGTRRAPTVSITFFSPIPLSLSGSVSLLGSTLSLSGLPDIPFSGMVMRFTGNSLGRVFTTSCLPSRVGGKFYPASGGAALSTKGSVSFTGCPRKRVGPATATGGWWKGLAAGRPVVHLKAFRGQYAASLHSVSVSLPSGLSFQRSAITPTTCPSGLTICPVMDRARGLKVLNAQVRTIAIKNGRLELTFRRPTRSVSVQAGSPLVTETGALAAKVTSGAVTRLRIGIAVTSASGVHTSLSLRPPAK